MTTASRRGSFTHQPSVYFLSACTAFSSCSCCSLSSYRDNEQGRSKPVSPVINPLKAQLSAHTFKFFSLASIDLRKCLSFSASWWIEYEYTERAG